MATDAWRNCRSGKVDPGRFGIEFVDRRGLWFVPARWFATSPRATRSRCFPGMPGGPNRPDQELDDEQLAYFDALAETLRDPDASFDSLRRSFEGDEGLSVPSKVFNGLLERPEEVFPS